MKRKNEIEKTFDESIAYFLKKRREDLDKTQEFVAEEAGISRVTLGKWEKGEKTPNSFDLYNVLKILHVDQSQFWKSFVEHFESSATPLRIAAEKVKFRAYMERTKRRRPKA